MNYMRNERHLPAVAPAGAFGKALRKAAGLLVAASILLAGCGGSSSTATKITPPAEGNPVIIGTTANSLPTPPAQGSVNRYAGIDLANTSASASWNLGINHPGSIYNYEETEGAGNLSTSSGGGFAPLGDFEVLHDTTQNGTGIAGITAEINSGVSLLDVTFQAATTGPMVVGVPEQTAGCLAPDGTVKFDFLVSTPTSNVSPATDALYGSANLTYGSDQFTYSGVSESTIGGQAATTNELLFGPSDCIQAVGGYAIQTQGIPAQGGNETLLTYLGGTGAMVGLANFAKSSDTIPFVGFVEPAAPINLATVTGGTYKGFYLSQNSSLYQQEPDPVYFGAASKWLQSPVFPQTDGTLLGGQINIYNNFTAPITSTPPTVPNPYTTANMLLKFGAQSTTHPGVFPNMTLTEQDTMYLCQPSQQSIGSDGNTYCTFPVVGLVGESYGKFIIYISGPEPTQGFPLFYALVQN